MPRRSHLRHPPAPAPSRCAAAVQSSSSSDDAAPAAEDDVDEEDEEVEAGPDQYAALMADGAPSAPDYADEMTFGDDPPGHRAGFVAIIGRPNAGKSTLLNALLGQPLSIVTPKAQTTRHRILGVWSEPGHQAVFLDTPGVIEQRRNALEERMMAAVAQAVRDADVLLAIVDADDRPREALGMLQPGGDWAGPPMAVVLNKADLLGGEELDALREWYDANCRAAAVIPVSALGGQGVANVGRWVTDRLPEGPSLYPKDAVAEAPERFFVSEIIRRQVFLQYRQELPYSVAVEVVEWKERAPPAKGLIRAHVIVEKPRQRGILLGAGGAAIKALSTAARLEAEEFLGRPVYLELSVKVVEGWRKDAARLEQLGY